MSAKKSMPKEVMEWVLEHIEYYCPMDEEAEKVMDEFVSDMYLKNWEAASGSCGQILELLGNNFFEYIYGISNNRKIVSKYLDAHTLEDPESKREYPIGWLKGKGIDLEKKAKDKRSKMVGKDMQKDREIYMKEKIRTEGKMVLAGRIITISGLILFVISGLLIPDKQSVFYISILLVLGGYSFWRVNDKRKRFTKMVNDYYKEMIRDKMCSEIPGSGAGDKNIVLHRVMAEDFFDRIKKRERKINWKGIRSKKGNLQRNIMRWFLHPYNFFTLFVLSLIGFLPWTASMVSEQKTERVLASKESALAETVIPGENVKIQVQVSEIPKKEPENEKQKDSFAEEGVIFKDSNQRKLRPEEIEALKQRTDMSYQEALGYARNEIYARMGYIFDHDGGKYTEHYSQYKWYQDTEKIDVTEDMFNQYERANIDLILKAEEELGKQE